jgi:hypothetical protein
MFQLLQNPSQNSFPPIDKDFWKSDYYGNATNQTEGTRQMANMKKEDRAEYETRLAACDHWTRLAHTQALALGMDTKSAFLARERAKEETALAALSEGERAYAVECLADGASLEDSILAAKHAAKALEVETVTYSSLSDLAIAATEIDVNDKQAVETLRDLIRVYFDALDSAPSEYVGVGRITWAENALVSYQLNKGF